MTDHGADPTGPQQGQLPPAPDWGLGHYERTAAVLVPAAERLVAAASLRTGERVLDLGSGTGTVALMAARAGAHTVAVDPAPRLRDVARQRALDAGCEVAVLAGDAAAIPAQSGSFDAVLSNFGVICAPDPVAAAGEMMRVLAPGGRIVMTAWLPGSAIGAVNVAAQEMVRAVVGGPPPPPGPDWSDPDRLDELFAPYRMRVHLEPGELSFTDASPAAYLEAELASHPLAVAGFRVLERVGQAAAAHARMLAILEERNEDPRGFKATCRYVVVTVTPTP